MTVRISKPAGAIGSYDFTDTGRLWKVSVPKGEWRDVVVSTDPGDGSTVVLSNNPSVSPRNPAMKMQQSWDVTYGIFGQDVGFTNVEVRIPQPGNQDPNAWPVAAFVQVEVVASSAAASPGGVTLRYNSKTPTVNGGDYDWPTEFILKNADGSTNGFVVQKVAIGFESADPSVPSDHDFWWEAWRVMNGRVFTGLSKTQLSLGDTAQTGNRGARGTKWHRFEGKFLPNYTEPEKWGLIPSRAGPLPATRTQPSGWMSLGTTRRSISVDFDGTNSTIRFLMENF